MSKQNLEILKSIGFKKTEKYGVYTQNYMNSRYFYNSRQNLLTKEYSKRKMSELNCENFDVLNCLIAIQSQHLYTSVLQKIERDLICISVGVGRKYYKSERFSETACFAFQRAETAFFVKAVEEGMFTVGTKKIRNLTLKNYLTFTEKGFNILEIILKIKRFK